MNVCPPAVIKVADDGDLRANALVAMAVALYVLFPWLLAAAAPRLRRTGELEPDVLAKIAKALRLQPADIVRHQWVDNGPGWCAVMLRSAEQVLSLKPEWAALDPLKLGVIGPHPRGHDAAFEVRAFIGDAGYEDPVTGSLNASLAQWLFSAGLAEPPYVAAQGAALGVPYGTAWRALFLRARAKPGETDDGTAQRLIVGQTRAGPGQSVRPR